MPVMLTVVLSTFSQSAKGMGNPTVTHKVGPPADQLIEHWGNPAGYLVVVPVRVHGPNDTR